MKPISPLPPITNHQGLARTHFASLTGPAQDPAPTNPLRQKAQELEGLFLNTLVSQMISSTNSRGMFGGGYAEETWKSMQAEQISNQISQAGGIGLADTIMKNLITLQGASTPGANGALQE